MTAASSTQTPPQHLTFAPDDQLPAPNPAVTHINSSPQQLQQPEQRVIYNKDGTKRINVVKNPTSQATLTQETTMNHGSAQSSQLTPPTRDHHHHNGNAPPPPATNTAASGNKQKKKKKKSKQKKLSGPTGILSSTANGSTSTSHSFSVNAASGYHDADELDEADDPEDEFFSDDADENYDPEAPEIDMSGRKDSIVASTSTSVQTGDGDLSGAKKKKKKKSKTGANRADSSAHRSHPTDAHHTHDDQHHHHPTTSTSTSNHHDHHVPPASHVAHRESSSSSPHHHSHRSVMRASGGSGGGGGGDSFWNGNSNNHEERQKLREFWLQLGEDERRSLVKVEKEAVLKKMKEQQKHSCSCSVCGRKRTAIEEELEILYDAYYEELEQYANHQQQHQHMYALPSQAMTSAVTSRAPAHVHTNGSPASSSAHHHDENYEEEDDEEDDDDEYEDDDEEGDDDDGEEYDDEGSERGSVGSRSNRSSMGRSVTGVVGTGGGSSGVQGSEYFNFGTVKGADPLLTAAFYNGGILTVADDLLKNDGKKFLDMMERLAERRMQREEEASAAMDQTEYNDDAYGEEDDDEYEEEEDEQPRPKGVARLGDPMTEEQRMEEGRRMFQIFAARMFEQRVLAAYREKVVQERQQRLLEELQEEERQKAEREAKKLKEKEKKKDKKRQLKQQKEEERLAKEAAKLAEEAAAKAERERKLEEQRRKQEEERLKKEEERRQKEDERLRKEEEKRKRLKEEKERELEKERKRKEKEEKERKEKEDRLRKEKEEREEKTRKEREAKEQKEKEEKERKEKVEKERLERDKAATAAAAAAAAAATAATVAITPRTPDRRKSSQISGAPVSPVSAGSNSSTRTQSPVARSINATPVTPLAASSERKQSVSSVPTPINVPPHATVIRPIWTPAQNMPISQAQMQHFHQPSPQMYNGLPQPQLSTPTPHMSNMPNGGLQSPYSQQQHLSQIPMSAINIVGTAGSPMNPAATLFHGMGSAIPPTQVPLSTRPPPMGNRAFPISGPQAVVGSGSSIPTSVSGAGVNLAPMSLSMLSVASGMPSNGPNSPGMMTNQMMGHSLAPLGPTQPVVVGGTLLNTQTLNLGSQVVGSGTGVSGMSMVGGLTSPRMGPGVGVSLPAPAVSSTDKLSSPVIAPGAVGSSISSILPIGHARRSSQQHDQSGVSGKAITRPNPIGKPMSSRRESATASSAPGMERSTSGTKTTSPPPGLSGLVDSQPVGSSALDGEPVVVEVNGGAGVNGMMAGEKCLNGGGAQQATHSFFSNSPFLGRDIMTPPSPMTAAPPPSSEPQSLSGINRNRNWGVFSNNGWSGSGRFFNDAPPLPLPQPDRHIYILDCAKAVYSYLKERLNSQNQYQHHLHHHGPYASHPFYAPSFTLTQMHHMFLDRFPDFPVEPRELLDTCAYPGSGFMCTSHPSQEPMISMNVSTDAMRRASLGVGMGLGGLGLGVGLGGVGMGVGLSSPVAPSTSQQAGSVNTLYGGML